MRRQHRLVALATGGAVVILLMGWTSGCALTGDPPRARIEAALPGLRAQVDQVTVHASGTQFEPEISSEDLLRVAMASCVRYYCPVEDTADPDGGLASDPEITAQTARRQVRDAELRANPPSPETPGAGSPSAVGGTGQTAHRLRRRAGRQNNAQDGGRHRKAERIEMRGLAQTSVPATRRILAKFSP